MSADNLSDMTKPLAELSCHPQLYLAIPSYTLPYTPSKSKKAATKSMNLNSSMLPAAALPHHLILILQQLNYQVEQNLQNL